MVAEVVTTLSSVWWGGPISDFSTSLGGQTFTGWLPPNSTVPDAAARGCPQPGQLNGLPGCVQISDPGDPAENRNYFAAHSKHSGGVTVALCDGSVRFVADTVDLLSVWRSLTTARGDRAGEILGGDW